VDSVDLRRRRQAGDHRRVRSASAPRPFSPPGTVFVQPADTVEQPGARCRGLRAATQRARDEHRSDRRERGAQSAGEVCGIHLGGLKGAARSMRVQTRLRRRAYALHFLAWPGKFVGEENTNFWGVNSDLLSMGSWDEVCITIAPDDVDSAVVETNLSKHQTAGTMMPSTIILTTNTEYSRERIACDGSMPSRQTSTLLVRTEAER